MREDDRLPRFNRYSIPPRPGTVECTLCPKWVKPEGMADHIRSKHPEFAERHQPPAAFDIFVGGQMEHHELDDEEERWQAEGRRAALDGMDLPDGAYNAMADELGLDPY